MTDARDWSRAFAVQADADFRARDALLGHSEIPKCQQHHFLQMACEKLTTSHLYYGPRTPDNIQSSHAHIAKHLPVILTDTYARMSGKRPPGRLSRELKRLAREIELLHPQIDAAGSRPDNCEYPWKDAVGKIHSPAKHEFSQLRLDDSAAVEMMKLLRLTLKESVV